MLSPSKRYQQLAVQEGFQEDKQQLEAIAIFDELFHQIAEQSNFSFTKNYPKGIYLWGSVGIGKTFLMDLFYESLPKENTLRLHYYQFMSKVHDELNKVSGTRNPLKKVAKRLIKECRILCLDELFVTEIADGMILYHLFDALFNEGFVLVLTSNFPVNGLYQDDLQPRIFDDAVQLLLNNTQQINLNSQQDYRLIQKKTKQTYFLPHEQDFTQLFAKLNQGNTSDTLPISICKRPLSVIQRSSDIIWFTFESLCCGPRSQLDYLQLSQQFSTILISDIPELGGKVIDQIKAHGIEDSSDQVTPTNQRKVLFAIEDNAVRRFISLIDELYDKGIKLYLSAALPLEELYQVGSLQFEFTRTKSRLIEMQSEAYLSSNSK
jgi:cell division protein ZapE